MRHDIIEYAEISPVIGRTVTVTVDRPLGSYHPEHKDMYYLINYGYVEGIMAPDGEEQDAYILGVDEAIEKFTGKENIIISTVDDEISDFADDPYLINVAVSRAKKKLMLVVTGNEQSRERNITELIDYIQYNNFEVTESKIYSIFDYLYKQYTEERRVYLQKHKKVSEYDSENLMYSLIEDIISANKYSR